MTLAAGRLRHFVTLYALVVTKDPDTGEDAEAYTVFAADVPAEVAPLSAREFISAQAAQSQLTTKIVMRFRDGLQPTMRIAHRNDIYDVAGVLPDPVSGEEYVTLMCTQVVPAAGAVS